MRVYDFLNQRMIAILLLGFSSGLPLGLTMSTLQAWYTVEGISIITIGYLALVGQPYVYKFLWAPVMDKIILPGGRRKGWILVCQAALILVLCSMSTLSPSKTPILLGFIALLLAFVSASQDIAIDAYRTEILRPEEKGTGAAMSVTGYRIAMLTSGGLALVLAKFIGFSATYLTMAACIAITFVCTLFAQEPVNYGKPPPNFKDAFFLPFKEFLSRRNAFGLLALVILYKFGDAFAGSLTTAFLLRGAGFDIVDVGLVNKTVGLVGTLGGVFTAGVILSKIGLYRSLLGFGVTQAFSNLSYLPLIFFGSHHSLMVLCVFIENFCGGLGTAAFLAFLMSLCDNRFTATQFAFLSALSAIGRVFIGPLGGYLVDLYGWIEFFIWSFIISFPGLLLLLWLKNNIEKQEKSSPVQTA